MRIIPEFPEHRRQDPMRQAELCIYNQVEASNAVGVALYECHPTPSSPEVDFVIILTGVAHYAVQVKGGRWRMEDGRFQLHTDEGWVNKTSPSAQAADSAYDVRNAVMAATSRTIFVVPILHFPDMEPDPDLLNWRGNWATIVLFGKDTPIVDRLLEYAQGDDVEIFYPPTAEDIAQELPVLMPGAGHPAQEQELVAAVDHRPGVTELHIHLHLVIN